MSEAGIPLPQGARHRKLMQIPADMLAEEQEPRSAAWWKPLADHDDALL